MMNTMTAAAMSRNVTRATTFRFVRLVQYQQQHQQCQQSLQSIQHHQVVNRPLWFCQSSSSSRFLSSSTNYNANTTNGTAGTANDDAEEDSLPPPPIHEEEDDASPIAVQWKRIIKPFLVKCHPDMAKQQGLSSSARQLNLRAIQNLNSYMNGVIAMQQSAGGSGSSGSGTRAAMKYPFDVNQRILEIDFVLALAPNHKNDSTTSTKKQAKAAASQQQAHPTTSRRKVELKVPPPHTSPSIVKRLVSKELIKLLHMAGLQVSSSSLLLSYMDSEEEGDDNNDDAYNNLSTGSRNDRRNQENSTTTNNEFEGDDFWEGRSPGVKRNKTKTAWERSRDAFTANIDWSKVDAAYEDAERDMHANYATRGMIRDNPARRRALLASILQRVQVQVGVQGGQDEEGDAKEPTITILDRLLTLRRLFELLDDHFDRLQLESCGRFWEQILHIQIVGPRTYNTSTSAMHRRRQRKMETGFGYTLHEDNAVTITIPVDFQDAELVEELDRNVWDFYNMMHQQEYATMGLDLDGKLY